MLTTLQEEKYKSVTVHISSAERKSGGTPSNFILPIVNTIYNVRRIKLVSVEMPSTFYPINSTNNVFIVTDATATTTMTVTISPGSYQLNDLITEVETQLNNQATTTGFGSGFDLVVSQTTYKFTLTHSTTAFRIGSGTMNGSLGFVPTAVGAVSVTAPNVLNISSPDTIYITSDVLSKSNNSSFIAGTNQKIIHKIINNVTFGDIIVDKSVYDTTYTYPVGFNLSQIDFQVRYKDGTIADLNGRDWSMSIIVYSSM